DHGGDDGQARSRAEPGAEVDVALGNVGDDAVDVVAGDRFGDAERVAEVAEEVAVGRDLGLVGGEAVEDGLGAVDGVVGHPGGGGVVAAAGDGDGHLQATFLAGIDRIG